MMNYVDIQLHMHIRNGDENTNIYRPFRNCRSEDFSSRNFTFDTNDFHSQICPDIDLDYELLRLEGKYTNTSFRQSFSMEMMKCNSQFNDDCKGDNEQKEFFDMFYYTFYVLQGSVQFTEDNLAEYPLVTERKFHSQF
jgi:hypothetical protein